MSAATKAGTLAADAVDAAAAWIDRLYEDAVLLTKYWQLLRATNDPSPLMRVKLSSAQAMLAALRVEEGYAAKDASEPATAT